MLTLTLDRLLEPGGGGYELSHAARSALNTACAQLKETRQARARANPSPQPRLTSAPEPPASPPTRKLAHKLANARKGQGQDRAYFSAVNGALDELEPGGVLLIPWDGECCVLLVIRRPTLV